MIVVIITQNIIKAIIKIKKITVQTTDGRPNKRLNYDCCDYYTKHNHGNHKNQKNHSTDNMLLPLRPLRYAYTGVVYTKRRFASCLPDR